MAVGRSGYGADFDSTLGRIISSVSEVWISQEREGRERKSRERDVLEGSWKMLHLSSVIYYIDLGLRILTVVFNSMQNVRLFSASWSSMYWMLD